MHHQISPKHSVATTTALCTAMATALRWHALRIAVAGGLALFWLTGASAAYAASLARSDGEQAGLSVEVTELKRGSGGTVTLKFAMVNNTKEKISFGGTYGAGGGNVDDYTVSGTHLIDAVNKKKYLVVRDSERKCVCSRVESGIPVGERMNLWAKFPAPPDDVKVIAVMIPHFAPMDDVPISP